MKKILLLVAMTVAVAGCDNSKPNVELIQDMMESPAVKAQEPGMHRMRVPPAGTVPRGYEPYAFKGNPEGAERALKNPTTVSAETLEQGKFYYETYCFVCHGNTGKGTGPVAEKMAVRPPSLVSDKVRAFNDGRIFHIITDGQGVMGPYASQIPDPEARWWIVNYVRKLQKDANNKEGN